MDPNHPIVILCVEGMKAESEGRFQDAARLFQQAWQEQTDDYHASVAAHFVARHAATPEEKLHWNMLALEHADAVADDESVRSFYPSLHLNLGHSYELLGNIDRALEQYRIAESRMDDGEPGRLGDLVRTAVAAALTRIASSESQ